MKTENNSEKQENNLVMLANNWETLECIVEKKASSLEMLENNLEMSVNN